MLTQQEVVKYLNDFKDIYTDVIEKAVNLTCDRGKELQQDALPPIRRGEITLDTINTLLYLISQMLSSITSDSDMLVSDHLLLLDWDKNLRNIEDKLRDFLLISKPELASSERLINTPIMSCVSNYTDSSVWRVVTDSTVAHCIAEETEGSIDVETFQHRRLKQDSRRSGMHKESVGSIAPQLRKRDVVTLSTEDTVIGVDGMNLQYAVNVVSGGQNKLSDIRCNWVCTSQCRSVIVEKVDGLINNDAGVDVFGLTGVDQKKQKSAKEMKSKKKAKSQSTRSEKPLEKIKQDVLSLEASEDLINAMFGVTD